MPPFCRTEGINAGPPLADGTGWAKANGVGSAEVARRRTQATPFVDLGEISASWMMRV
jgi:hypothetical protein